MSGDVETTSHQASHLPRSASAVVHLLQAGYVTSDEAGQHVGPSIGLILDGPAVIVVDPGMVASREALLSTVREFGVEPGDVSDIVFSHHHPDHTINAALFEGARIHDHWATYDGDLWHEQPADRELSPSVRLVATPGHTMEDISTVVGTASGVVVFTHAWWAADGPEIDPFTPDQVLLERSRDLILGFADVVVPGHGAQFRPAGLPPA